MKKDISYSNFFKNYGIFISILIVIFGILIYFSIISQKSWKNNLKTSIETVLNEIDEDSWTLGNNYKINNPLSLSSALYDAKNKKNGENYKAMIIRVQTFYGPLPAVFIIDKDNNVTFKGYASLHGRVANQIKDNNSNKRINYWKEKIPTLIQ